MAQHYDVIVVGGGPVGLFLGLTLALKEIRVLVIEQTSDISQSPRALMYVNNLALLFATSRTDVDE